jgi:SAM-dependent methyltransferase
MPRDEGALFDQVAELYDRARQGYPRALFDDLVALSTLPKGAAVLEIGCGTGQATRPLAERGYLITAVELGPNLAAVARRELARFPDVVIHTSAFEEWPLPEQQFDLVMSATAFHWLDPEATLPKVASALKAGGAMAIFSYTHVAGGDQRFFDDVQACYEQHMPGTPPGLKLSPPDEIPVDTSAIDRSALFESARHRRYVWERTYTTRAYVDVLNTYSTHLALSAEHREALLRCVASLLDSGFGGRIRKAYMANLIVAKKR